MKSTLKYPDHIDTMRTRYNELKERHPTMRIRQIATHLGVSELELIVAQCGDVQSVILATPPQSVFRELGRLGRVMALTRNDACVHERHGCYEDIRVGKATGLVLGPDIDLRVFFDHWATTLAVNDGGRKSIQFFDSAGNALHKVYVTEETNQAAYTALVNELADMSPVWPELAPLPQEPLPANTVLPEGFRDEWLAMQDTHEFHGLLKKHDVARLTALQGIGGDLAQPVSTDYAERLLTDVARLSIPFMCFVGNHGMIQIHSGPVAKVMRTGPWFNVLEPHFNLHLDTTALHTVWVVNKPSTDGWVTSLECFDAAGRMVVQFFGARKPGVPELTGWRDLLVSYCPEPLAA